MTLEMGARLALASADSGMPVPGRAPGWVESTSSCHRGWRAEVFTGVGSINGLRQIEDDVVGVHRRLHHAYAAEH